MASDKKTDSGTEGETDQVTSKLLHAIQNSVMNNPMANMPASVKRRIRALKNLQLSVTKLEADFYQEVHALEVKYLKQFNPHFEKRAEIVSGKYEPADTECQWESEDEEELEGQVKNLKVSDKPEEENKDDNIKGIPGFWLTIFKNVSLLSEMVQEHDEPILQHLEDIKLELFEKDPMGFNLNFHFSPNEYFSDAVLTKKYFMKCLPDHECPFDFEGPEIYKCEGCTINWSQGKNVTVKTIKKKQKHKSRGAVRTVIKTVQNDSFFNFFNPPSTESAEVAEDLQELLGSDFEIGHYIRERVVPHAVLLYTGEGLEEEEDYEEEDDMEENSTEESSEEEEEDTKRKPGGGINRNKKPNRHAGAAAGGKAGAKGAAQNHLDPADCKQQ